MNPIFLAIILGEVAFWVFLSLGLLSRYVWKKEKLSLILLAATPLIDLFLLGVTFMDLSNGTKPTFFHGLSAAYIAFSIVYGHQTIKWADQWANYRWNNGTLPEKITLVGEVRKQEQWRSFYRFCKCSFIMLILIGAAFFIVPFQDAFWLIYWLVAIISSIFIWFIMGPLRFTTKKQDTSL
ncbi:hypothetical protein [Priestia flexa]|uniref:hypothetical protein n=1 Tax=Priestia flexa TaxID=86664 RepID=UPI001B340A88|nr:hypothetical protein [Priestia flexa]